VTDEKGRPIKKAVVYTKQEHAVDLTKVDGDARRIVTTLRQYGFETYIVGGAVRDLLLDHTPKDFDIATEATPQQIKKLFSRARIIGKRFRLVHVVTGPKIFEVSTFRSIAEGTVGNSFGTVNEDALRRDFTINALYYDPVHEQIVDYVGGFKDIERRVIEPVIPLATIFTEDPVRMVRAVKYAATTGFTLPSSLKRQI
jgi:poly(A) polymerase